VNNYITRAGALRLQAELIQLRRFDRPKIVREVADAAAQGDRSENAEYIYGKKKLREIDRRMRFLILHLADSVMVEPSSRLGETRVFFGATVVIEDDSGKVRTLQIVGVDEVDVDKGRISYRSPLGASLLMRTAGDAVSVRTPNGETEFTLLSVCYT
jgi:transcription elongation factor GreB